MITVDRLGKHGRLGNQLFQYAMLRAVAIATGFEAKVPRQSTTLKSDYVLHKFAIEAPTANHTDSTCYQFREPKGKFGTFLPAVFEVPDGTAFRGYFQSWKYFANVEEQIRREFRLIGDYSKTADAFMTASRANGRPLVSIHVRRGDYLQAKNRQLHRVLDKCFYVEAMRKFPEARFICFSDDLQWCRREFTGDSIEFAEGGEPWLDLALMSRCDHHIIACSTFSWWGAWLNSSTSKRVIAPFPWVGSGVPQDSTADLYPPDWEQLGA